MTSKPRIVYSLLLSFCIVLLFSFFGYRNLDKLGNPWGAALCFLTAILWSCRMAYELKQGISDWKRLSYESKLEQAGKI